MNFSNDDPLADLLSDNSIDNDSFFDNLSGTKISKNPITKAKGKVEDLFGIKEEAEIKIGSSPARRGNNLANNVLSKSANTNTPRITRQQPSQSNKSDDDDDLGFDPKKPKAGTKVNLDDLLSSMEAKRPATAGPLTNRKDDTIKPPMSRQSTDTAPTTETSNYFVSQARPKTSTGRRSSNNSAVANTDPLGIFSAQFKEKEPNISASGMSTPMTRRRGTTADWLGLNFEQGESADKRDDRSDMLSNENPNKSVTTVEKASVDILKIAENPGVEPIVEKGANIAMKMPQSSTTENILMLNSMDIQAKNAYYAMQQQESQLQLAVHMKNHENALIEMQRKQESFLQLQKQQFTKLLEQQMQRQNEIEKNLHVQQEKISAHMQLLMAQQALGTIYPDNQKTESAINNHTVSVNPSALDAAQMEADIKRLECENSRLQELLANTKGTYEKEIELIEFSYKKQLQVLHEHINAMETRLKADVEEQTTYYMEKITLLDNENQKLKSDHENYVSTLKQDHEDELRKIRRSHEDDLEIIKEEHRRMLETIRQSKMLEFAAVHENSNYLETLKMASNNLENLSGDLHVLRDDMQTKIDMFNKQREKALDAREQKQNDAEKRLRIAEECAEADKTRLMELVSSLEFRLSKLSKETAEDNWIFRQKMAALESEKASLEKEKEYARDQMARDEKRIEDLKEQQLAETQRAIADIQEERARLLFERKKLETEKKLHLENNTTESDRIEFEASLKIAQDATRQADAERERYYKMQRQAEQHKRELVDKTNMLRAKEDELEHEMAAFRLTQRKTHEAQQKAQLAEQNFISKQQYIQQRLRELGDKEANLSQERALLTQERIALHRLKAKLRERNCALCKIGEQNENVKNMLSDNAIDDCGDLGGDGVLGRCPPPSVDIVERMLDENIAESYRKMKSSTNLNNELWSDAVLDDDSKKLAMHRDRSGLEYGGYELLNKILLKD